MAKKCSSCSGKVSGIENLPYMMIVGGIGAAIVADKVSTALITNADGTPKVNDDGTPSYLVANPKVKDIGFVAVGAGAMAYADGNEIITGLGFGAIVFGGYNLITSYMTPTATSGMYGMGYIPPNQIAGVRVIPGAAGYSPGTIGTVYQGMEIPTNYQPQAQMNTSGKIRATG
jgi:hypothetical protein